MITRKDFICVFTRDIVAVDTKIINSYVEKRQRMLFEQIPVSCRMFLSRDTIIIALGYVLCKSRGLLQ